MKEDEELAERLRYKKGELPHGTDICKCPTCGWVFNSTYAFDFHRVGGHGSKERRCLTVTEMREAGMERNRRGRWISSSRMGDNQTG